MANEKEIIVRYDTRGSFQRIISKIMFIAFLALCIYISQGSAWWTFFTGSLMILVLGLIGYNHGIKTENKFTSKRALKEWVESLPEDPQ